MCVSAIFFCSISATISIVETCDLFFSFIKLPAGIEPSISQLYLICISNFIKLKIINFGRLTCFLFVKKTVTQVMITLTCIAPFVQILTSAPAVLTTATVHLLPVQTQRDPLVAHVTVLPAEMAELVLYHQVINWPNIRKISINQDIDRQSEKAELPLIFHTVINHQELRMFSFTRPLFTLVRSTVL